MDDTPPEIQEKVRELIRAKTPEERLKMGCSMYDFSKSLIIRSILEKSPGLSPAALKRELFLRFYGNDFDPERRQKIMIYLGST